MVTYAIAEGWRAVRYPGERAGLDELALENEEAPEEWTEVWRMEIPPKMPEEELISQASMLARLWEAAWDRGIDYARRAVVCALDNLDVLGGASA